MNTNNEIYDIGIIGGGPGGYTAAIEAKRKVLKVALIEKERVGGTCLNRGCIPTQCLLHDLNAYSTFMGSDLFENGAEPVRINFKKILERKSQVVNVLVTGTEKTLLNQGVRIFYGEGTFLDPQTVATQPSQTVIRSKAFIIATGARFIPQAPFEIDHRLILDTTDALQMDSIPATVAILGNGHRAMTFAQILHSLGSRVTICTEEDQILPDQDHEISSRYRKVLKAKGVDLLCNARVMRFDHAKSGEGIELEIETQKGAKHLHAEKVLVPGKRQAEVQGLNLEGIGISLRNGFVPVDRTLLTDVPGIYAIGDVIGGKCTSYKAMNEGRELIRHITGGYPVKVNYDRIPFCLYTNPEVASIGISQEEAEKRGIEFEQGYFPFAAGARPLIQGQGKGSLNSSQGKNTESFLGSIF